MTLNPEDERRLRRNWSLLKQELRVDDFVHKFVDNGVFAPTLIGEIANVMPNTPSMKGNARLFKEAFYNKRQFGTLQLHEFTISSP
jgi:hypothetical protein